MAYVDDADKVRLKRGGFTRNLCKKLDPKLSLHCKQKRDRSYLILAKTEVLFTLVDEKDSKFQNLGTSSTADERDIIMHIRRIKDTLHVKC